MGEAKNIYFTCLKLEKDGKSFGLVTVLTSYDCAATGRQAQREA